MSVLLAWLWQGAALACATAVVLRLLPRAGASTRHAAWWLTLAAVLALPCGALFGAGHVRTALVLAEAPALEIPSPPGWTLDIAAGAWAAHVVLGLVGIAGMFGRMRRLRRSSQPLPPALQERLSPVLLGRGSRGVAVRLSYELEGAAAVGLWSPVILLSARLVDALRPDEVEQVVAHEHAHLARRDDWTRLAQALIDTFAGLHPAVWFISRQIDIEREAACDDWAVARGDALGYAECLASVAALAGGRTRGPALLPGMLRRPSSLRRRVTRLLDARRSRAVRLSPAVLLATTTALVCAAFGVFGVPPVVVVDAKGFIEPPRVEAPRFTAGLSGVALGGWASAVDAVMAEADVSPPGAGRLVSGAARRREPTAATALDEVLTGPLPRSAEGAITEPVTPLVSARLEGLALPAVPAGRAVAGDSQTPSPWGRTADAGVAVGASGARAGRAVAGAAHTAGRSIAGWFGRVDPRAADGF